MCIKKNNKRIYIFRLEKTSVTIKERIFKNIRKKEPFYKRWKKELSIKKVERKNYLRKKLDKNITRQKKKNLILWFSSRYRRHQSRCPRIKSSHIFFLFWDGKPICNASKVDSVSLARRWSQKKPFGQNGQLFVLVYYCLFVIEMCFCRFQIKVTTILLRILRYKLNSPSLVFFYHTKLRLINANRQLKWSNSQQEFSAEIFSSVARSIPSSFTFQKDFRART